MLLAQGDPHNINEACAELERLADWYEDHHERWWLTRVRALQSLVFCAQGKETLACDTLAGTLAVGESCGLMRTFLDLGPAMAALLSLGSRRWRRSAYLESLLEAFQNDSVVHPDIDAPATTDLDFVLYEPLTSRNRDSASTRGPIVEQRDRFHAHRLGGNGQETRRQYLPQAERAGPS